VVFLEVLGCIFCFIGFDAVSTAAQEAKDPQKRNANWYFRITNYLYYFICSFLLLFNWFRKLQTLKEMQPVTTAFAKTGYTFLNSALTIAIIAGYTSVMLVMLMGQSRVFYSMSVDGLLPKFFSTTFKKNSI
jgi:APA family basic amino acid/polyamine antiporter